jgi:7-cyano-7-deazaguanine synthase
MSTKILVVLSGGQDSTTCLAIAMQMKATGQVDEVHALTFDYGQRHRREIDAAYQIGRLAGVDSHEFLEVGAILKGTSPLTDSSQELEQYADHDSMAAIIGDRVEKTFVPMRNALFLTLAANRAVVMGAKAIMTGVCEADNANYPDCRYDFISAQQAAINEALGFSGGDDGYIDIITPLMFLSKAQSIKHLLNIGGAEQFAWLAFSHTAYDGQYPPLGKDHATVLRAHGFEEAGYPDPLILRAVMEGAMPRPTTKNYERVPHGVMRAIDAHIATSLSWSKEGVKSNG